MQQNYLLLIMNFQHFFSLLCVNVCLTFEDSLLIPVLNFFWIQFLEAFLPTMIPFMLDVAHRLPDFCTFNCNFAVAVF